MFYISTKRKIYIARLLYKIVSIFSRNHIKNIKRKGILYEINIEEGIDLSMYLFGHFQKHITQSKYISLAPNNVILDIGGNFGMIALQFAQQVPQGKVISFEPTDYAIQKFIKNINLNPTLKKRITIVQSFVSDHTDKTTDMIAFSSWKLNHDNSQNELSQMRHPIHLGIAIPPPIKVGVLCIDDYIKQAKINQINLIKIDTDGNELKILQGAIQTIANHKPKIIFEIGLYIMQERYISFKDYWDFFQKLGYELRDLKTGKSVNINNYKKYIPQWGTTDLLATPILATH